MPGHRLHYRGIIRTAAVLLILTAHILAAGGGSRYAPTFKRGIVALSKGNPDSAIACFVKSYSEGLSRDSLFYFWSEALLQKGVLDSALAANYIVSKASAGGLRVRTLLQRATIYRRLGWDGEAAQLLDTVRASREYRRALFAPEIDMGIAAGYGAEQRTADTAGPWGAGAGGSFSQREKGPFGKADIRSSWKLTHGSSYWAAGVAGSVGHRQYTATGSLHAADSTDITGSVFSSAIGESFSSTYAISVNRRIDDSLFFGNSVEGGIVGEKSWLPMLWGGGSVFLTTSGRFGNSRIWLFASAQQALGKRLKANYQFFANSYFERSSFIGFILDTAKIIYAEDARRQYPVFHTDSSYSGVIDTSMIRVITGGLRNEIAASGRDSVMHIGLKQPFSGLLLNPRFSLTLRSKVPVRLGFSWKWHYFWERCEWDRIAVHAHYLIYSRADEKYYVIPEDILMNELTITRGTDGGLAIAPGARAGSSIIHHSLRRIDNNFSVDMSVQLYDGRSGTAALQLFASKTWSTLLRRSPIEIPEWAISTSLEWRMKISSKLVQR